MKIALVTGAGSGLGLEAARQLLARGFEVHVACRTRTAAAAVIATHLEQHPHAVAAPSLNLCELANVRAFVADFAPARVDVLVCNAGIMMAPLPLEAGGGGTARATGSDDSVVESHVAVNFLAHFLLTRLLAPKLRAAHALTGEAARVINVSSDAHLWVKALPLDDESVGAAFSPPRASYDHNRQYALSKLFQIYDTIAINREHAPHIIAFAVHPGVVATNIARHSMLASALFPVLRLVGWLRPQSPWAPRSVADGVRATIACATASPTALGVDCASDFGTRNHGASGDSTSGSAHASCALYYRNGKRVRRLSALVLDEAVCSRVMAHSRALIGDTALKARL
jgi:NAD(P)-dependent dehydrogenase (short-subunit alcohol dehydrogenase family)